jgi:SAM-dependent methyltransferase
MNYEQIFAARGSTYDHAMQRWPEARRDDFAVPLGWLEPHPGEVVVDVPAGGGYLRRYLPQGCRWFGHEPCASFREGAPGSGTDLLPLPWADDFADAGISVAGVHHLDDKEPLFRELRRVIRPGGRFVLADVHADSAVARFLDEFVGRYNSTGHAGRYLGNGTLVELEAAGWRIERSTRVPFAWWFPDRASVAAYCRMLFDMRDIDDDELLAGIDAHLGLCTKDGSTGMRWELFVVRAG